MLITCCHTSWYTLQQHCYCRFTEEASKLLHSLEAWAQSEEHASQAYAAKVQQCFGIQVEARYATIP